MRQGWIDDAVLAAWLVLFWFVSGVTLLQGLGNYPLWLDMGAAMDGDAFAAIRRDHYPIIYPLAVWPGALSLLLNLWLAWRTPAGLSRWLVWAVLALGVAIGAATVAVEIPLQDRLDADGYDAAVIRRLIETDFMYRKLPGFAAMALAAVLTWQAVGRRRTADQA